MQGEPRRIAPAGSSTFPSKHEPGAGAGVMIALTLAVASIGAVVHVFNVSVMFFAGKLVPVAAFPRGVQILAAFVPTTLGVRALNVMLGGGGLDAAASHGIVSCLRATALRAESPPTSPPGSSPSASPTTPPRAAAPSPATDTPPTHVSAP
jgi:hypothetical protein